MNKNEIAIAGFTVALLLILFYLFKSVIAFLSISAVLAILGAPLMKWFQKIKIKKFQIGKGSAAFLTLFCFYIIVSILFINLLPVIASEAKSIANLNPDNFIEAAQKPIQQLETEIEKYTHQPFSIELYLKEKIVSVLNLSTLSTSIGIATTVLGNILVYLFTITFITFFFLKDGQFFFDKTVSLFPKKYQNDIPKLIRQIKEKLRKYLTGLIIQVIVLFVAMAIGLYVIGIENYLLIAFLAAILNLIPYLGPIIAVIFAIIMTAVTHCSELLICLDSLLPLLGKVLIVFGIAQMIDNLILQPVILSKSINAHPLEIFLVVILSGNFYGITGMILAIPVYSALKIIFLTIRKNSTFLNSIYGGEQ